MSRACGDQLLDIFDRLNAAAGAGAGAVQSGGSTGENKLTGQRPALQKSIDKSGVEDVAGAGGVQRQHAKGGRVVELGAIPGQDAFVAQRCRGEAAAVAAADYGQ